MDRYSEAHHVRFALFDDNARSIVGGISELPDEVHQRILERFPPRPRRPGSEGIPSTPPPLPPPPPGTESPRRGWRPPIRALMRTTDPTRYWLLSSGRLDNPRIGEPMRIVLVARSSTISAGGLILDPKPWLLLGAGIIGFSLLFWLPLVRGMTRTLKRMMNATRQIADGRFDVRVNLHRGDELGALAESVDQMAGRLDGFVSGQKRFLGDIAHELCSPLARMQMALGIIEQRATPEQAEFVRSANEKAEQMAALVGELLSFSKASYGASAVQLRTVNVREIAEAAIAREGTEGSSIHLDIPAEWNVSADPELLLRALSNLLRNAIRHAGTAGAISLGATREGEEIAIIVADQGPGVPENELPRIFDAFYRVDPSRARETGGTGLGLAIVKTCIESCGGTVAAHNLQPKGLEVTVRMRAATTDPAHRFAAAIPSAPAGTYQVRQ
jgi:two-component system sensor histidine kinase CpxA